MVQWWEATHKFCWTYLLHRVMELYWNQVRGWCGCHPCFTGYTGKWSEPPTEAHVGHSWHTVVLLGGQLIRNTLQDIGSVTLNLLCSYCSPCPCFASPQLTWWPACQDAAGQVTAVRILHQPHCYYAGHESLSHQLPVCIIPSLVCDE